ncbi:MAG TPA: ABC transporter substrate-binding protein [Chloroflexota bacterium]|nr:ABC transporter substrate-binding protein [Chloroflexota bacterium]
MLSKLALSALLLALSACSSPAPAPAAPAKPAAGGSPAATGAPAAAAPPAAAPAAAQPTAPPAPASIKVGVNPILSVSGLFVAMDRGYFAEQGLDVSTETITSPTAMVPALATNQVDVGTGAMSASLWNAIARGAEVRLAALQSAIIPGIPNSAYVVRKADLDSGAIGDFASLRGKRVSNNGTGNFTQIVLWKAIELGGLTPDDVQVVDIAQPEALVGLLNGSLDVAALSEPVRGAALAQPGTAVWKEYYDIYPNQQATAWVYSPQFARERADIGKRTMVALLKGIRDFYDGMNHDVDRDAIIDIVVRHLEVRDRAPYANVRVPVDPNGEFDVRLLQDDIDWYVANGFSPQRVDAASTIDRSFVDYALQQLGRYQR